VCCGNSGSTQSFLKFAASLAGGTGTYYLADGGVATPATAAENSYPTPEPFYARSFSVKLDTLVPTGSITFNLLRSGVVVGSIVFDSSVTDLTQRLALPNNGVRYGRNNTYAVQAVIAGEPPSVVANVTLALRS